MVRVETRSTVKGIDSNSVGSTETLATNQLWIKNSRQANGRRGMDTRVSKASAKNSPSARSGLEATPSETTAHALLSVAESAVASKPRDAPVCGMRRLAPTSVGGAYVPRNGLAIFCCAVILCGYNWGFVPLDICGITCWAVSR